MVKTKIDYKAVGERIKNSRLERNLTQDALAELINVNSSFVSNIERGKTKMSTETLASIARSLYISVDYLLFGEISLDHDQYTNIAVLEIKELLKNKDNKYVNAFLTFCKDFANFLKKTYNN